MHLMLLFRSRVGDSLASVASLRNNFLKLHGLEVIIIIVKPEMRQKINVQPRPRRGCSLGGASRAESVVAMVLSIVGGTGDAPKVTVFVCVEVLSSS